MGKADFVLQQKAAIVAGQDSALQTGLEAVWDESALEQKSSDGTLSQGDLDKAVADQKAADQVVIDGLNAQVLALQAQDAADVKAGQDAVAAGQAALVDLQAKFDSLSAKEQVEAGTLASFQASKDKLQAVLDALNAIVVPAPQP